MLSLLMYLRYVLLLGLGLAVTSPGLAQTAAEADKLNAEVNRLYQAGKYAEAMPIARQALALRERALGPEHPSVAVSLNGLAELYRAQRRYGEAEPLLRRSLAIVEKALGAEHREIAVTLNILGEVYRVQGRYAEAEAARRRSLDVIEKALGPDHRDVAAALNNLGLLLNAQGRYNEAEPLYRRSLAIREKALGPEHPEVSQSLNNVAELYRLQGRYAEAEPVYRRSLAIREKTLGPEHPSVAVSLNNMAWSALGREDFAGAADHWRSATAILRRDANRVVGGAPMATPRGEAQRRSWYFEGLVKVSWRLATAGGDRATRFASEMFEMAQWARTSDTASSVAQMAVRSAKGSPDLAALVRERQDLVLEWQVKDRQLIAAWSELPSRRNAAAEKMLTDRLAEIDARLVAIDTRVARGFPNYAALTSPNPLGVADVQAILRDDEALVLLLDTSAGFKPLPEETFIWVVTKTDVRGLRSELGAAALHREVTALRCGIDAAAWDGDGAKRCLGLLNLSPDMAPRIGGPLPFDIVRAHALYRSLFGEAAALIRGKHLLVVPSGTLATLPFQVLVTEVPVSNSITSARWLIRDYAITVLPSVASLAALRRTGKPSAAPKPLIGFGNPLLDGDQGHPQFGGYFREQAQRARDRSGCVPSHAKRSAELRMVARSLDRTPPAGGRFADLGHLRLQAPLPETADELCEVMRTVGGNVDDVRLGARATEAEVKRLSESGELAKYRILHFATHGTLAGQLSGTTEPGLILTPPAAATPEDDGYLSGSEVASLKLDADLVILSACNTAGGAGEGEAVEALSGLARVFFYAGARALLVSHWEVDSDAAVKLVTGAVGALTKDKGLGRAEAHRRAMLAMMDDTTRPKNWVPAAHPSVWAPFVVVGEGGSGR